MTHKIFIDDIRDAPDDSWIVVRSYKSSYLRWLMRWTFVSEMSLDHDMGEDEPTGYGFLRDIEERAFKGAMPYGMKDCKFTIHSANPVGRKNMQASIDAIYRFRERRVV